MNEIFGDSRQQRIDFMASGFFTAQEINIIQRCKNGKEFGELLKRALKENILDLLIGFKDYFSHAGYSRNPKTKILYDDIVMKIEALTFIKNEKTR